MCRQGAFQGRTQVRKGDAARFGSAWQSLFGLRAQCRCALLRPPAVADSCPACAGQSCQRKRFPDFEGETQVRGRFGRNFLEWQRRHSLRRTVEVKEAISKCWGRKTRAEKSRCSVHVAACCRSPLVILPIKSFRKGKGGAGERGQPFFKRVSPSPRISLLSLSSPSFSSPFLFSGESVMVEGIGTVLEPFGGKECRL